LLAAVSFYLARVVNPGCAPKRRDLRGCDNGAMTPIARFAVCALALPLLVSCGSSRDPDALRMRVGGLVAQLRGAGTAATGAVRVYDYRDGVQVQLAIDNLIPGRYRIAFHENPNCRSPNLFSAGPPWAPPGSPKPAAELMPGFTANAEGNQNGYVVYLPGIHTEREPSVRGRSVVIHWGDSVSEAFPGQPNNRVACGVLEWTEAAF
jgi:Cu/Zn superoxide dismutase